MQTGDLDEMTERGRIRVLVSYSQTDFFIDNAVKRGFARDNLFVCVHEQFMTDTAKMADIVLPAQLHPVVLPHVSHFRHVPFRTSVKFPHSGQLSPS